MLLSKCVQFLLRRKHTTHHAPHQHQTNTNKPTPTHQHPTTPHHRADLLDPALMRPGRFDRKIRMPKPDTNGRYEILRLQLRDKKVRGFAGFAFGGVCVSLVLGVGLGVGVVLVSYKAVAVVSFASQPHPIEPTLTLTRIQTYPSHPNSWLLMWICCSWRVICRDSSGPIWPTSSTKLS